MGYYGLLIIAFLFGLYAQTKLSSTYSRYSRIQSQKGLTGSQVARFMLDRNGLTDVNVEHIKGNLTDHYDPRTKVVRLSDGVHSSSSIAAIGIAAHECGHAIQHHVGYTPLKIRNAIIPITNIGSQLSIPLILIGVLFTFDSLITIGIVAYGLMALFQLITLPVEFNASNRALATIDETQLLVGEEYVGAKATLKAAALTYVAALMAALAQLLQLIGLFGGRRRND